MTTRTDIHRPSAPDFDPQDYTLFGVYNLARKMKVIDSIEFIPPSLWIEHSHMEPSEFAIETKALESHGWSTDIITNANGKERDSVHAKQCAHCGQRLKYGALLSNESEKSLIVIGEDCLWNRFQEVTAAQFKQLREDAKAKAAATRSMERKNTALKENPGLAAGYDSTNSFVQDVMRRFDRKGEITERQLAAVLKVVKQDAERAERKAQWTTEAELAADAPTGKVTVTGEIISTKWQESMYGSTHKMILKTEAGWKLWVTVPNNIYEEVMNCKAQLYSRNIPLNDEALQAKARASCPCEGGVNGTYSDVHKLEGVTVTLTATVTPSDRDSKFAFGKRPSKAKLVS